MTWRLNESWSCTRIGSIGWTGCPWPEGRRESSSYRQSRAFASRMCAFLFSAEHPRASPTDGESGFEGAANLGSLRALSRDRGKPMPVDLLNSAYYCHPTAVIDQPCEIGNGTKIWHFSPRHVWWGRLVRGCNLGQNVVIASGVKIGITSRFQNNVSVYTGVELENDVFCGPSIVSPMLSILAATSLERVNTRKTLVKRGASLGANCTIVWRTTIGELPSLGPVRW